MEVTVRCETLAPAALEKDGRSELVRMLFPIHLKVFDGVDEASFTKKVLPPQALWTKIGVFRTPSGEGIGYCALHLFEQRLQHQSYSVFRAETGILPAFRGKRLALSFFLRQALSHRLRRPLRRPFLLCTLVHPSSYHLIAKHFAQAYPRCSSPTPPATEALMYALADAFGEVRVHSADPSIRQVGWITRDTSEERARWAASTADDVRFFLENNPDYGKGLGLVTLIPLTTANVLQALYRLRKTTKPKRRL